MRLGFTRVTRHLDSLSSLYGLREFGVWLALHCRRRSCSSSTVKEASSNLGAKSVVASPPPQMWALAIAIITLSHSKPTSGAGICDGLGLQELYTFATTAITQIKTVNAIENPWARAIAQRAVCASLMNNEESPVGCLTEGFVNETKNACKKMGACQDEEAFDSAVFKLCDSAKLWTCTPPICHATRYPDALLGCFDLRNVDDARTIRSQFGSPSRSTTTALACARSCAASSSGAFFLEDGGHCACGLTAFSKIDAAEIEVEANQCGAGCRGENIRAELPCGKRDKVTVFDTAKVLTLGTTSASQVSDDTVRLSTRRLAEVDPGWPLPRAWHASDVMYALGFLALGLVTVGGALRARASARAAASAPGMAQQHADGNKRRELRHSPELAI